MTSTFVLGPVGLLLRGECPPMTSTLRRRRQLRSPGQSLVEFALILPVLLLSLLIVIDFGRLFYS